MLHVFALIFREFLKWICAPNVADGELQHSHLFWKKFEYVRFNFKSSQSKDLQYSSPGVIILLCCKIEDIDKVSCRSAWEICVLSLWFFWECFFFLPWQFFMKIINCHLISDWILVRDVNMLCLYFQIICFVVIRVVVGGKILLLSECEVEFLQFYCGLIWNVLIVIQNRRSILKIIKMNVKMKLKKRFE
jgi:hypothetical protein